MLRFYYSSRSSRAAKQQRQFQFRLISRLVTGCLLVLIGVGWLQPAIAQQPVSQTPVIDRLNEVLTNNRSDADDAEASDETDSATEAEEAVTNQRQTAPVVLNDEILFEVATAGELQATERAKLYELRLMEALNEDNPPAPSDIVVGCQTADEAAIPIIDEDSKIKTACDTADGSSATVIGIRDRTTDGEPTGTIDSVLVTVTREDLTDATSPDPSAILDLAYEWQSEIQEFITYNNRGIITGLLIAAVTIILAFALDRGCKRSMDQGLRPILYRLIQSGEEVADTQSTKELNIILKAILLLIRIGIWLAAFLFVTNQFALTRRLNDQIRRILQTSLTSEVINLGQNPLSLLDILLMIAMVFGLVIASGTVTNIIRRRILNHITGINRGLREAIAIVIKYGFLTVGVIILLQIWGIDFSSLAILASALSVGIGFGLQDIAKNFGSGLVLVFERPIQIGDFVQIGEFMGTVERLGARSTEIKTLDQVSIIVPNSRFLENEVINWSHRNPVSRLRIPVGVAYSSDPAVVESVLIKAGQEHPNTLAVPAPYVFFTEFGDSSLNFELLVWIAEPAKQVRIKSDLYFAIERSLREHNIEIPFPQRDLHVRSGALPLELPPELQHWLKTQQSNQPDTNGRNSSELSGLNDGQSEN